MFYPYIKGISLEYLKQHRCAGDGRRNITEKIVLGIERKKSGKDARQGKMKPAYTIENIDRTVALYLTGLPTREVTSLVGLSLTQVTKIVRRAGLSRERMAAFNLSRKRV